MDLLFPLPSTSVFNSKITRKKQHVTNTFLKLSIVVCKYDVVRNKKNVNPETGE